MKTILQIVAALVVAFTLFQIGHFVEGGYRQHRYIQCLPPEPEGMGRTVSDESSFAICEQAPRSAACRDSPWARVD